MNLFETQTKKFITDLKVGQRVDAYFKILTSEKRLKKDGGAFLTIDLMDKTGKIAAKVWENAEAYFKIIKTGEIYRIYGQVNEYMGKKELRVDGLKPAGAKGKDYDPEDYVEKAAFDIDDMFKRLIDTIKSNLTNKYLLQLTELFAMSYHQKFKTHYGAQKIHHAYKGGLLDHTYSMVKSAVFVAEQYSLDKDLLLIGVLFHDVGKMFEFKVSPAPEMTMAGGLVGHIVIGNSMFLELKNKIENFPEDLCYKIQHLILSHHGEKEFGSPEVPRLPEAYALHVIDLLDSKLKIMEDAINKSETKGLFTDYIHSLGRRMYAPENKENQSGSGDKTQLPPKNGRK